MSLLQFVSIPVVFGLGFLGSILPHFLARNVKHLDINTHPIFRFFNGFASGIVMAVAFVHSIPDAFDSFGAVMTNGTSLQNYSWSGFLTMMGVILTLFLEEFVERSIGHHHHHVGDHVHDAKANTLTTSKPSQDSTENEKKDTPTVVIEKVVEEGSHGHYYTQLYILFFGLSFHSFFVGLALGIVSQPLDLFIAIVCHQFFEGLALGSRLADANFKKRIHIWIFDVAFSLAAPFGTGIGIGISNATKNNEFIYSVTNGTFQALSGGILVYVSLVHMLKEELERKEFSDTKLRIALFIGFLLGAAAMSIIGIWA